ncbi:hypothetical protein [Haliangium sp.]|uniref:hypothetical protein n=1 Tax=Haliangium sp. TaxID=2663208 RepID=UPI003D0B06B2
MRATPVSAGWLALALAGVGGALAVGLGPGALGAPPGPTPGPIADAGVDADPRFPEPGGRHWRLETAHGPVHAWTPPGHRPERAGVAVYVHGYYTGVDRAWREHHLAAQFAASGRDALFIAPEAPARRRHLVYWRDLDDLVREVRQHAHIPRPWGPTVVMGHSGAYRTLEEWLDDPPLSHLILLDGLYGDEQPLLDWLEAPAAPPHRLTLIGLDTLHRSELVTMGHPLARHLDWLPETPAELAPALRDARLLHIRSQYGHMELVTEGRAVPLLLRYSGLPAVASGAGGE